MNKTAIKNFAVWAREKLISDITYKAGMLGITEDGIAEKLPQSTNDLHFFDIGTKKYAEVAGKEITQRNALVNAIKQKEKDNHNYKEAFQYVVEEVAYTWFNRLIAIRFMEVNDYLPSGIRVLSSENKSKSEPDFVTNPFDTDLEFTPYEQDRIIQLKDENKLDELFRMLFIKQCNKLHDILPELFEKTDDYTELLLTISFTDKDGVVYRLVHDVDEADFDIENVDEDGNRNGQVEIIGWLYQYYNSKPKDQVFANLKKNIKISKENIPAATQLFTPDWIVRYMVENSLGRIYVEQSLKSENLSEEERIEKEKEIAEKMGWKYYLPEAEQEPEVRRHLNIIHDEAYENFHVENLKCIDPCMGSGHILVYMFDVLMQIYEAQGYSSRDAAVSIVENNLYGLDIDERAAQLAYFAVMMKARQYDRRFFSRGVAPRVYAIAESNNIDDMTLEYFINGDKNLKNDMGVLVKELHDAKEYGSILDVTPVDFAALYERAEATKNEISMFKENVQNSILPLIHVAEALAQKYDVVVTNPPYMGSSGMGAKLGEYVKKNYPDSSADMFSVFIEKGLQICVSVGYVSMITMHGWMFIDSYYKLRKKILSTSIITSLAHHGIKAFEFIGNDVVQTCAFILFNSRVKGYKTDFVNLTKAKNFKLKETEFFNKKNYSLLNIDLFMNTPTGALCYWVGEQFFENYKIGLPLDKYVEVSGAKNVTGDNDKFLRLFWEIEKDKIGKNYWVPCAKGGAYRKYYGNIVHVIDWRESAKEFYRSNKSSSITPENSWFKPGVTYSSVSSRGTGFRYVPEDHQSESSGPILNFSEEYLYYFLGFFNTKIAEIYLKAINPSINLQKKDLKSIPYIVERVEEVNSIVKEQIDISKSDWSSFETTFEFKKNALIPCGELGKNIVISEKMTEYTNNVKTDYNRFCQNELVINNIFKEIYGFDDFNIEFERRDVSVKDVEEVVEIKALISYAVGCMLGRYSLDTEGLAYAGGDWDDSKYKTFIPDEDNCIPITDEEYFEDDIVGLFCAWLKKVYGEDTLEENLDYIAKILGNKGNSNRQVIRNYFLNDFIKDHIKTYQKRPIYWLFDSGKQNGFKALVYMHRWNADTIGNMRVEYLHRMQRVYEKEMERMQEIIETSNDNKEIANAIKRKEKLQKQLKETKDYDAKVAHLALSRIDIDLDDGVKVNYEKVQTADGKKIEILTAIK